MAKKKSVKKKVPQKRATLKKRDNRPLEMVAENLIAHFLQRHGLLVAKPHFDQEGGDLLALTSDGDIRWCKIQSKGRSVRKRGTEVKIDVSDVSDSLVVCVFVDDGSFDKLNLFVFFSNDIEKWPKTDKSKKYRLGVTKKFETKLAEWRVTEQIIERISNEIMKVTLPTTATYKYTGSGALAVGGNGATKKKATKKKVAKKKVAKKKVAKKIVKKN